MPTHRCLMIGAGGFAGYWVRNILPALMPRLDIVGLVDINEQALKDSADSLGLPAECRFADQEEAFDKSKPDFCLVVTPPAVHEVSVHLACERGVPILSEKPVAETWAGCLRIRDMVRAGRVKMMVVQNYRFTPRILTFKQVIESGRLGRLNYLLGRFAADYRQYGAWAAWRHEIPHSLPIEGSVHHLDQLRNLAGADCETLFGYEWHPDWSSFKGTSTAMFLMRFANGVPANYEGSCNAAGHQNNWHAEYYRAECEGGAVVLDEDHRVLIQEFTPDRGLQVTEVPHVQPQFAGHEAILSQFLDWLEGGPTPATVLEENMKSVAMVFAAIRSAETGMPVNVREMVSDE